MSKGLLKTNQRLSEANYALFHATFVCIVLVLPDTAESPTRASSPLASDDPDRVDTLLNTLMTGGIAPRTSSGKSAAAVCHGQKDKQGRKEKRDCQKKRIANKKGKKPDRGEESETEGMHGSVPGAPRLGDVAGTLCPQVIVPRPSFDPSGLVQNMDPLGSNSILMEVVSGDSSEEDLFCHRTSNAAGKRPAVILARALAASVTPVQKGKTFAEQYTKLLARFQTPTKPHTPKELAVGQLSSPQALAALQLSAPGELAASPLCTPRVPTMGGSGPPLGPSSLPMLTSPTEKIAGDTGSAQGGLITPLGASPGGGDAGVSSSGTRPNWTLNIGRIARAVDLFGSRGPMSLRIERVLNGTTFVAGNQQKASALIALTKAANMPSFLWETGRILLANILAYHALPRQERKSKVKKSLKERGLAVVAAKRLGKKTDLEDSTQVLRSIGHLLLILVQMQEHVVSDPFFLLLLSDSMKLGVPGDELDRILRAARGEGPSEAGEDDDKDDKEGDKEGVAENGAENDVKEEVMGDGDEVEEEE
ncbi:hypothetical protein MMC07_009895 [Pseudocyphellaria aurata]|nr:hypothetical protein [Pseudocyphellaria aurata]